MTKKPFVPVTCPRETRKSVPMRSVSPGSCVPRKSADQRGAASSAERSHRRPRRNEIATPSASWERVTDRVGASDGKGRDRGGRHRAGKRRRARIEDGQPAPAELAGEQFAEKVAVAHVEPLCAGHERARVAAFGMQRQGGKIEERRAARRDPISSNRYRSRARTPAISSPASARDAARRAGFRRTRFAPQFARIRAKRSSWLRTLEFVAPTAASAARVIKVASGSTLTATSARARLRLAAATANRPLPQPGSTRRSARRSSTQSSIASTIAGPV